ncbi:TIGR03943 family putative permease subunit [Planctomonas deserti]|uniref:TIGR03943 family putative permease subunit n=1 Tax=Planctomonas deserti TaxID=2144185 RepID=UPI000D34CFF5|nr:TIGR03943 family protein [Planctomonas deserti]
MRDRFVSRWAGVLLSLVGIVATVWLAATGQLGLYIHPRYYVFTTVMAVTAAVFTVAAFAIVPASGPARDEERELGDEHEHDHHHHGHDHDHDHDEHDEHDEHGHDHHERDGHDTPSGQAGRRTAAVVGSVLVTVLTTGALLVLPPATLTTSTVDQRDLNASVAGPAAVESADLIGGDYSTFTVKDWASLIRQGADEDFFADKSATLTGFVTPDPDDPDNVFYVARFVVTCCAVDAQPVGVAVYSPDWASRFPVDSWVTVTGPFGANPSLASLQTIAITPEAINPTEQPNEPYVY